MLRFLFRKLIFIFVLLVALAWVKRSTTPIAQTVGGWISGVQSHRVTQAFCDMVDNVCEGRGVKDSMEVFCETLQD